jgi:hypothetical protein
MGKTAGLIMLFLYYVYHTILIVLRALGTLIFCTTRFIFILILTCLPYYMSLQINLARAGHSRMHLVMFILILMTVPHYNFSLLSAGNIDVYIIRFIFILMCLPCYMSLWVNHARAGQSRIDHVIFYKMYTTLYF